MNEIHFDLPPSPFFICVEGNLDSNRVCLVGSRYSDMSDAKRTVPRAWEHYRHILNHHRLKAGGLLGD